MRLPNLSSVAEALTTGGSRLDALRRRLPSVKPPNHWSGGIRKVVKVIRSVITPSKENQFQYDIEFVSDAGESVTICVVGDKHSDLNNMISKARATLEEILPGDLAVIDTAGYKILSLPETGGFAACDDDGCPISPTFSTRKEAALWTGKNPRIKTPILQRHDSWLSGSRT